MKTFKVKDEVIVISSRWGGLFEAGDIGVVQKIHTDDYEMCEVWFPDKHDWFNVEYDSLRPLTKLDKVLK